MKIFVEWIANSNWEPERENEANVHNIMNPAKAFLWSYANNLSKHNSGLPTHYT